MNDQRKMAIAAVACGLGVAVAGIQAYRVLRTPAWIPAARAVSIADLARQEKKDPSSLTDDQRRLLATIPPAEKKKLLTKPSFNVGAALAEVQKKRAAAQH